MQKRDRLADQEVAHAAMRNDSKMKQWDTWREQNQAAINSMNRYVEKHGLLSDKYRLR